MGLLRLLVNAGYLVTFARVPRNDSSEQQPQYAARLRYMGVLVLPPLPPKRWALARGGPPPKCMYEVIIAAQRQAFEAVRRQVAKHCPGVPVVYAPAGGGLVFLLEGRDALAAAASEQVHVCCGHLDGRLCLPFCGACSMRRSWGVSILGLYNI